MDNNGKLSGAWSDRVEALVDRGDVDGAISVLESVVSNIASLDSSDDLRLAAALSDLADLQSSKGFSLKADEFRSRALLVRARALNPSSSRSGDSKSLDEKTEVTEEDESVSVPGPSNGHEEVEDDWEAIADSAVSEGALLSSKHEGKTLSQSHVDPSPQGTPKRRGRGSFLYQKSCLYSDQPNLDTTSGNNSVYEDDIEPSNHRTEEDHHACNLTYGTDHVLVLYDFAPTTRTVDLEKLFDNFRDRGVAIRWVDDTTALAVFRTPFMAREAQNSIRFSFKVRQLEKDDDLLGQIPTRDLEPPFPRPKTSVRTAQRLIAQGMGIKFSTDFGSTELRKQEEARKNRIQARQTMKDDAWGPD